VDGAKLSRAIYNLLLNASQASRKGPIRPTVTISLSDNDERIRISVTDTGNGVPPAILATLFQPFVSFGKVNGTGLGLTVAQHIAQEHGGEVKLEDTSPRGTTFSILLYKNVLPSVASHHRSVQDREVEPAQEIL
jgi:signal transduction histidine kinase